MNALSQRKVLVVNKHMTAVGVVSLQRAVIMLFSTYFDDNTGEHEPKAHILDGYTPWTWEEWAMLDIAENEVGIRACSGVFKIPEVIKLNKYDRIPQHQVHFSRRTIYKRDNNTCIYCHCKPGTELLTIDHIEPRSAGGLTTWENCVLACVDCNSKKADRRPTKNIVMEPTLDDEGLPMMDEHGKPKQHRVTYYTVYFNGLPNKTIRGPKKPTFEVHKGDLPYESWKTFLDKAYWNIELKNDNQ